MGWDGEGWVGGDGGQVEGGKVLTFMGVVTEHMPCHKPLWWSIWWQIVCAAGTQIIFVSLPVDICT